MHPNQNTHYDVVVVGAGQAGLAVGYHLRRTGLTYLLLDASPAPGGAWPRAWPSLRLFSPADASSLPGWLMPPAADSGYPTRDQTVDYLTRYEQRYELPVHRPVRVTAVRRSGGSLLVETDAGAVEARAVVSATGGAAYVPPFPGRGAFAGRQIHSTEYPGPEAFTGASVLVVGAGNSAAQIAAELSAAADTVWATREPPRFLPDDVDGRALFTAATERYRNRTTQPVHGLGDIVMVPPVKAARDRGALKPRDMPDRLAPDGAVWPGGRFRRLDAIVWCTGFRPALEHLEPLGVLEPDGRVLVDGTRSRREPLLWLVGYGAWTGFASATLIGVGRSARATVAQLSHALSSSTVPGTT